jgi:tetratricopeptide (TPR) repeat protein
MKRAPGPPGLPGLFPAKPGTPASFGMFNPAVLFQNAQQAHTAGRLDAAEQGYRQVLKFTPKDPMVLAFLGTLLLERGRWAEGVTVLDASLAIDPTQQAMLTNRGNALIELGRFKDAMASYHAAIDLEPELAKPAAYNNLGAYLQGLGRNEEALELFDRAIGLEPETAEAWGNRGIGLSVLGRHEEALNALDRALQLDPVFVDAMTNRGICHYHAGRMEEALAAYEKALSLAGPTPDILSNMALALHGLDRLDEALSCCELAIAARPEFPGCLVNRGIILLAKGRFEEAIASYDKAMAINPEFPDAYWNKALVKLLLGDFENGGPLYERRWDRSDAPPLPMDGKIPVWLGKESLEGKVLLLLAEQGFGDTLQMVRYAPMAKARGAQVILGVQPPLLELALGFEGVDEVVGNSRDQVGFDLFCPLMSLPLAFGTTPDTIPANVPYIAAPAASIETWGQRLGPRTRRRIGLVWSGNPDHKNDRNRSVPLERLLSLLPADADYISLQREYRPGDLERMAADGRVRDVSAQLESFVDTAALVHHLDLVVSVDTAVAHLAGAMAKPLYLLLPWVPDFRWLLNRTDSPWYPTARLFRQPAFGDWSGALEDLAAALR